MNLDLPATHAAISAREELLDARRTLYQVAAVLAGVAYGDPLPMEVIDSPCTRGALGRSLATGDPARASDLVPIGALAVDIGAVPPLAARPAVNGLLADALAAIGGQLAGQAARRSRLRLLSAEDEGFTISAAVVAGGVALARSASPALVEDLLAHTAVLGMVDPVGAEAFVSASSRAYPGLVLLGRPETDLEVAEGLVHESAHQKFFDLAITGAMLTHHSDQAPDFTPSWGVPGRRWPMEQTLAAGHAYACLAQFAGDLGDEPVSTAGPSSLLPFAHERCELIGKFLEAHRDYLGRDAHRLLRGWQGPARPTAAGEPSTQTPDRTSGARVAPDLVLRSCAGGRVVVGRPGRPPDVYFVTADAATLLELLMLRQDERLTESFADASALPQADAEMRVATLMRELLEVGLLSANRS